MIQASSAAMTVGDRLRQSPSVHTGVASILGELRSRSAEIRDIRAATPGLREPYEAAIARAGELRGRGLYYPYIGSGMGNGALVELADGSVKWDMICGIGVHFFGHCDTDLIEAALFASIEDVVKHGNLQTNAAAFQFADALVTEASRESRLRHCFLSTGGALANENALKICYQKHAPASRVMVFKDCFMGRTNTMAQLGDGPAYRQGLPLNVSVDYVPFYDEIAAERMGQKRFIDMVVAHVASLIERYPRQHACFVFELLQGEGGFNTAPREFFVALMDVCKAGGIAIWDDEIQTFGRLDRMFAYETLDLGDYIDVLSLGKMSHACATLFTPEYNPKSGLLSGTFTGETVSFAVGTRVIERLRDSDAYGADGRHARHHRHFVEQVRALAARHPDWFPAPKSALLQTGAKDIVGGRGGMMRFTPFGGEKDRVLKACHACYDEGVIVFYCGHDPYHLRMLPPLGVMREEDWPRVFEVVERGLARIA
ncbi:MAG: aminotransferase class III-fold pyridoxal phosphate-dependent enzyme [Phycisphaeraceae bacterium]|nr:aminotransferase class III-fold pyridoxal phosphate-dependent enzyme [Phycisphaeraceae bacterium]